MSIMDRLRGKVAVITGGGSGIGESVAKAFLGEGASVAIAGRDPDKLQRTAQRLNGGDRLIHFPVDVSDPGRVADLMKHCTSHFGRIDILVNNAGMNFKERGFRQLTVESWQRMLRANLDGAFFCIHQVLPQMIERQEGVIINISSVAGKRAGPLGGAAYAASKFGMSALGICLGAEEKDSGIRVSNIYPGEVDTPILEHRPTPVSDEQRRSILRPDDVAAAVLFVATLPAHVSVPELVIKPTAQVYI